MITPTAFTDPGDPTRIAASLRAAFAERHGGLPDVVAAAPGRINVIGEHVDYNGGSCLPAALPHTTVAAVRLRADDTVTVASAQRDDVWTGNLAGLGPGHVDGWPAYVAGVLWAMRERGVEVPGVDVVVDGRVPLGAGLSSSAALECSVALALGAALGLDDDEAHRRRLVADCMRAESEVAGAPTGGMDQTVSLLATPGHALLLDCASGSTRQVPWDPEAHGLTVLVIDTRAHHALVDGGYAARRADCEEAARLLGVETLGAVDDPEAALATLPEHLQPRARHVFTEIARVHAAVAALEDDDLAALGALLTASHASLRDDYEVSCPELDAAVTASLDAGALGARMIGGGFGGSAIALVETPASDAVAAAVSAAFAKHGWTPPAFLEAPASDGARLLP